MNQAANSDAPVTATEVPKSHTNPVMATVHNLAPRPEPTVHDIRGQFVDAMRVAVSGVNVVTTNGSAGQFGLTISAMCSVSADPVLLLICVNRKSAIHEPLLVNRVFCVNVLSAQQHDVAKVFSGTSRTAKAYNFGTAQWERSPANVDRLIGAIATFDCVVEDTYSAGTHQIFVGRVTAASADTGTPLLYTDRSYGFPLKWE